MVGDETGYRTYETFFLFASTPDKKLLSVWSLQRILPCFHLLNTAEIQSINECIRVLTRSQNNFEGMESFHWRSIIFIIETDIG